MQENENAEASNIVAGTLLNSDNGRAFLDGSSRSDTTLRSAIVGLGTYHAGWKWSLHAGAQKALLSGSLELQFSEEEAFFLGNMPLRYHI